MARKSRWRLNGGGEEEKKQVIRFIAGGYVRISVKDKNEQSSIQSQEMTIQEFLKEQPEIFLYKIYKDNGISSFGQFRLGYYDMMEDVRNGIINCVIVKDLSRLGRNYIETGHCIEHIFPFMGIRFISINDQYDSLMDSERKAISMLLKSLANYAYALDISAKVKSVIQLKQENGTYIPALLPYGYRKENVNGEIKYAIDKDAAKIVRQIFDMAIGELSCYHIAGKLNEESISPPSVYRHKRKNIQLSDANNTIWLSNMVKRILQDRVYTGIFATGKTENILEQGIKGRPLPKEEWIIIENHHEPITIIFVLKRMKQKEAVKTKASHQKH